AALAARLDEPGPVQRREVLGHRLAGDRQLAGEPRGGQLRALGERAQDLPARRVGERGEDVVYARQICKSLRGFAGANRSADSPHAAWTDSAIRRGPQT